MFYDQLQQQCDLQGVSVSSLLDSAHLSRGNIAKWKTGNAPKASTKILLAQKLGLPDAFFIQQKKPAPTAKAASAEQQELIRLFDAAPQELRAAALAVLKSAKAEDNSSDT